MRAKKFAQPTARRTALAATLARFVGKQHFDRLRDLPLFYRFAGRKAIPTPDPVSLAVLAIDRVGPAAVRACASGIEVRVAAPDEATATVLRQALAQTARRRDTDRLIRIVVD
jgi:hypothetical protein